jgi:hypothetical protein
MKLPLHCRVGIAGITSAESAGGQFWLSAPSGFGRLPVVEAALDSTAVRRPKFFTTQWGLVTTASVEGSAEARVALDGLYRVYCYPVYAFIR